MMHGEGKPAGAGHSRSRVVENFIHENITLRAQHRFGEILKHFTNNSRMPTNEKLKRLFEHQSLVLRLYEQIICLDASMGFLAYKLRFIHHLTAKTQLNLTQPQLLFN